MKPLIYVHDGAPGFEPDKNIIRRNEVPFRRGFCHAGHFAIAALRGGATIEQLEDWLDRVDAWRFDESKDAVLMPPQVFPSRGKK